MKKKEVIADLHTHWDREWYREFEVFRLRLLKVFDNVLDLLEAGKIPSFYFDGQTAAIEDYLELRPEKLEIVKKFCREKKLFVGPFYCLVDEFLTDKKCFEKNLEFGLKHARALGCEDFIGYLPDTFGHSKNIVPILRKFGLDKAVVWRGCGDFPSEFVWMGLNTVNLVRGYFMDFFSADLSLEKKAELIKNNLDKIAEKSLDVLLLPIGGDHLGVEIDIQEQIKKINDLLPDYEIHIGSLFEYFEKVKNNLSYRHDDELRDCSKTFILPGSYSSRLDLKKYNQKASYLLHYAQKVSAETTAIDYAYKLLLQNQAHDGICGCSTDLVHRENIVRYEKVIQIAKTLINESIPELKLLFESYEFESLTPPEELDNAQLLSVRQGFDDKILNNTQRVPITEDYTNIYRYLSTAKYTNDKLYVDDVTLKNDYIELNVISDGIFINGKKLKFVDFKDLGDTYNIGYVEADKGNVAQVLKSNVLLRGDLRCGLRINTDILDVDIYLDKNSKMLRFCIDYDNQYNNHYLQVHFELEEPIIQTISEDVDSLITRNFDPDYKVRENLPKVRGVEAKTNTAPMQRFVFTQGLGFIACGQTQYEVLENILAVTLLRCIRVISDPENPARSTPAGPPLVVNDAQMLGHNYIEFGVSFSSELPDEYKKYIDEYYNKFLI